MENERWKGSSVTVGRGGTIAVYNSSSSRLVKKRRRHIFMFIINKRRRRWKERKVSPCATERPSDWCRAREERGCWRLQQQCHWISLLLKKREGKRERNSYKNMPWHFMYIIAYRLDYSSGLVGRRMCINKNSLNRSSNELTRSDKASLSLSRPNNKRNSRRRRRRSQVCA